MSTVATPRTFAVQHGKERYHADHGWLKTYHSFSFADYFDPENMNWGALRVFNDDYVASGTGFPTHPHRDMEIITYVFAGELEHQDSMGNRGVVGPGGVQFMSAGTGVRHSEYSKPGTGELHLVQMWVLPGSIGSKPSYGQVDFTINDRRNTWLHVASGLSDVEAPIPLTQRAVLQVTRLEDHSLVHTFAPKRYGFLFVADGIVEANGEQLHAGDAVRIYDIERLHVSGNGELVLWDLPGVDGASEDAE